MESCCARACTIFPDSVTAYALGIALRELWYVALKEMVLCTGCSGKSSTIDKGMINMKTRNKVSLDLENIEFGLNTREFV